MIKSFEPGALLGHVYTLEDGLSVRLRLARTSDVTAVRDLLAERGLEAPELEAARLVHFDPRHRYVVCATALIDGSETLVGIGAIALDGAPTPQMVIVGAERAEEVAPLLSDAITQIADSVARARAA